MNAMEESRKPIMENQLIQPDSTVSDVLQKWPQTIPVFLKHQTSCVGCSMSAFESISQAAEIYHISLEPFLAELREAAKSEGFST
jgi:hybrid cluster-associated redox disulfide protein